MRACAGGCGVSTRIAAVARSFQTRATLFEAAACRLNVAPSENRNKKASQAEQILPDGLRVAWKVSGFIKVEFPNRLLQLSSEITLLKRQETIRK